jgi:hypothetical protein
MQKDLIRTDEERAARLQLVKANRLQRQEKILGSSSPSSQKSNRRVSDDVSFKKKHENKNLFSILFKIVIFNKLSFN